MHFKITSIHLCILSFLLRFLFCKESIIALLLIYSVPSSNPNCTHDIMEMHCEAIMIEALFKLSFMSRKPLAEIPSLEHFKRN